MFSDEKIRSEQSKDGRRRILGVKPGHAKPRSSPAMSKGHDAILGQAQDSKANIAIIFMSGHVETGMISARDKYTITLENAEGKCVIFKHAISRFRVPVEALV